MDRTNLAPEKVPWKAIRTLLSDCIYGSKIDNGTSFRPVLTGLASQTINAEGAQPGQQAAQDAALEQG